LPAVKTPVLTSILEQPVPAPLQVESQSKYQRTGATPPIAV
jgi:hypothetical protein